MVESRSATLQPGDSAVNKNLCYVTALVCALAFVAGCGDEKTKTKTTTQGPGKVTPAAHEICDKCGEVEGSTRCCVEVEGVEICEKCKRHEGSPGCCAKGHHIHLCKECGVVYDGDAAHTCNITEKCEKCGMQKGSPGCCLKVEMKDKAAEKPEKTEKTKTEKTEKTK